MSVTIKSGKGKRSPQFAHRLTQSCNNSVSCPPLNKGRLGWIKERLAERELIVTIESIRRWLSGEGRPTQAKCEKLADVLKVDPVWLYMGKGVAPVDVGSPSLEPGTQAILPIAVRPDVTITVKGLPLDLTHAEATRIANIILAHTAIAS